MPDGEDVYLQAGGTEDRDRWAHALGAVIRSLSTSKEVLNIFNEYFYYWYINIMLSPFFYVLSPKYIADPMDKSMQPKTDSP